MTAVFSPTTFLVSPPQAAKAANSRLGDRVLVRDSTEFQHREFTNVHWSNHSARVPRARGTRRLGLEYEQRVTDVLAAIYGERFMRSPAIGYRHNGIRCLAILDGLLYLDGGPVIIEVKLAHTERVWEQLMERYLPLVERLHPHTCPRSVEVCRSYDPAVPVAHTLITSLHDSRRHLAPRELEVLRWRI